jgi:hypothetical protein
MKVSFALLGMLLLSATACGGGGVENSTYVGNGGVVKIEFKPDGKAFFSTGPMTQPCTYTQKDKAVTLICAGNSIDFTVGDDGALNGPPDGMAGRLTKEKQ